MINKEFRRGLMTQYPCARGRAFVCKNIGDYVQSVASNQFVNPRDVIIEQEEADTFKSVDGRPCRLIMNGWFQWRAENWPPSEDVYPLLVSMHISPLREEQLLCPKGIEFLKKYSPVGCRDHYTEKLLNDHGIPAYFSACVTLTLGKNYHIDENRRKGIYIVDPYFSIPSLYNDVDGKLVLNEDLFNEFIIEYSKHSDIINKLASKNFFKEYSPTGFLDRDANPYRPYYKATCFYKVYKQRFSDDLLLRAEYITHWMDVDMANQTTEDLFDVAEGLVKKYASAELVITSRIHAGLPCLGMNTPVVFIANDEVTSATGTYNTPGRLGGLVELFRILKLDDKNVFTTDDPIFEKIVKFSSETKFENRMDWKPYADRLIKQLTEFMSDDFNEEKAVEVRNIPPVIEITK